MSFERVIALDELEPDVGHQVKVDGHPLCLVRIGPEVAAIYDVCSHQDYPLHEGYVFGRSIECALHGSTFALDTGEPEALPATVSVPVFATRVEGGDVLVDLDQKLNDAPIPDHF
ncbi:MAG: Rieske (2Fe-2S) protein [Nitriliruptorales bacterium]